MSFLLFMVMAMFLGVVRGAGEIRPLIVGGAPISIVEVPWAVALFYDKSALCGGSILNDRWILTAAHCTDKREPTKFQVLIGTRSLIYAGQRYPVDKIVVHENYDGGNFVNDISVMRTKSKMNLDGNPTRAVNLPPLGAERPSLGTTLKVVGWGRIDDGSFPNDLRAVDIQVQNFTDCNVFTRPDENSQFCAFLMNQDSCNGDSGGPATLGTTQVGIVSYGRDEPCGLHASVYTLIVAFRQWIKDQTGT